jgi:hypothetical protein
MPKKLSHWQQRQQRINKIRQSRLTTPKSEVVVEQLKVEKKPVKKSTKKTKKTLFSKHGSSDE